MEEVHFGSTKVNEHGLVSLRSLTQHKVVHLDIIHKDIVRVTKLDNMNLLINSKKLQASIPRMRQCRNRDRAEGHLRTLGDNRSSLTEISP